MSKRLSLLASSIFLLLLSAGCSTVVQGYNNLVHGPQATSGTAADAGKGKSLPGNAGTVTTVKNVKPDVEQVLAYDLRSQAQTLRFSILARDRNRAELRTKSILKFCARAEKRLKKVDTEQAAHVKHAIDIIRVAAPIRDVRGLDQAIKVLVKVRTVTTVN